MERHSDGAGAPDHGAPDHGAPDHGAPDRAGTGDDRVDEALGRLGDLDGMPIDEHPAVFEHVHRGLTAALGALDSGPDGAAAPSGTRETSPSPAAPGS